jgi:diacylglycerol kinase (ATP)
MMAWLASELRRLGNTAKWSWDGWVAAWASEKSLRQWTIANVLSAALAFSLPLSPGEKALILALGVLVLAAELVNTAIETIVDYISDARHPLAGRAKDCGSAAVALTAIAAGIAWAVLLWGLWRGA